MSTRISHNILSMNVQRNIHQNELTLNSAMNKLASGLRVQYAWDDAAGLAVSEKFRAQIGGMTEAERNANYNINLLSVAEGALQVIDEDLIRMRQLAIDASNGALTSPDRSFIDIEFQQLKSEITRVANVYNYNRINLLNGQLSSETSNGSLGNSRSSTIADSNSLKFHIGSNNNQGQDYYYINMGGATATHLGLITDSFNTNVLDTASAQATIDVIDTAITSKDTIRAFIGSLVNRLQGNISELQISRENAQSSESTIRDADIASEMSDFTRAQILFNSGISMLTQSNALPNIVAGLIG